MSKVKSEIVTTTHAARLMMRAFLGKFYEKKFLKKMADAHLEIIVGRNEETLFLAGTTTMLGGIILELEGSMIILS